MDEDNIFLISELKKGNKAAFEVMFKKFYSPLCSYAHKYLTDDAVAEDIVSDFFMKLYQKKDTLEIHTSLKSYLFKSVRNLALNYIRDNKNEAVSLEEGVSEPQVSYFINKQYTVHEILIAKEVEEKIFQVIDLLPDQCRQIFEMSRFKGMKYKEISEELNLSVNTVETQMSRALKKLRVSLKDHMYLFVM